MPQRRVTRFLLLPELEILSWNKTGFAHSTCFTKKKKITEYCPRCGLASDAIYDHREVKLKDAPVRGISVVLRVKKRRLYCKSCRKPFTEPLKGVGKRHRTTQRYRREVRWAAENFSDLTKVRRAYRCSSAFVYKVFYEQLAMRVRRNINYPWPSTIGIDEHFFSRSQGYAEFATVFTDYNNKRLREVARGKNKKELMDQLADIEGRENVRNVVLDMSDTYRSFAKEFFPNAKLIADKFHVLRLLTPALNRRRKEVTGDKRKNPVRKLLLRSRINLKYYERDALELWLRDHPEVREVYHWKERLMGFYRIRGYGRAQWALIKMTDDMALSKLPEIKRLRRTLMRWRAEILAYFYNRLTNARTEGFNNIAKLEQKRAFGYKSFQNYRLRLLNACA
jgi:transposase